jgi:hypothetical protein
MSQKTSYEHGARKPMAQDGPDPSDEFSQNAAENRKPPPGAGLSRKMEPDKRPERKPSEEGSPPKPDQRNPPARDTHDTPAPTPDGKNG